MTFIFEFPLVEHSIGPITLNVRADQADATGMALFNLGIVADAA